MKKFFLFAAAVIAAINVSAADKEWCFTALFTSSNAPTFTIGNGATPDAVVEGELYVYGNAKDKAWAMDFGQSPKYFVDFLTMEDRDSSKKMARLKSGGAGSVAAGQIKGAIAFCVAGNSFIQIAAVSSDSKTYGERKMQILNAKGEELESFIFDGNVGKADGDGNPVDAPFEFEYEGPATTLFIVSANQATQIEKGSMTDDEYKKAKYDADGYVAGGINYYKIAATNVAPWSAPQGIEDLFYGEKAVKFVENGQLVIVKNGVKFNALGVQL